MRTRITINIPLIDSSSIHHCLCSVTYNPTFRRWLVRVRSLKISQERFNPPPPRLSDSFIFRLGPDLSSSRANPARSCEICTWPSGRAVRDGIKRRARTHAGNPVCRDNVLITSFCSVSCPFPSLSFSDVACIFLRFFHPASRTRLLFKL